MRDRGLEFKVGLLILGALMILGAFIFVLGNFSLGPGYHIYVDYNFSGNIQPGAPVKVSGIKVGKVQDVQFWGGKIDEKTGRRVQVRLKVWVQKRVKDTIREDAEFFVNTAGVLGEQYLEIAPGSYDKPALPPDSIVVGVDPPRTDLIVARLYEFLDSITTLLHEDKDLIRNLLKNGSEAVAELNTLLQENRQEIRALVVSTEKLANEATATLVDVRAGIDPKMIGRLLVDADRAINTANNAVATLSPKAGRLLDDALRVTGLLTGERVDKAFATADSAIAVLGKAGGLIDNVDGMVTDVRAGRGTAGKLLVRDEVYADVKELVRDLRRNPWKFFWKE